MKLKEASKRLKLLRTGEHSDLTLIVIGGIQKRQYNCHKIMLVPQSKKFEELTADKDEVELRDTDPDLFFCLLYYMYTEQIRPVHVDKIQDLFSCANTYGMVHFPEVYIKQIKHRFEMLLYYLEYSRAIGDDVSEKKCEYSIQFQTRMVVKKNYIRCLSSDTILWLLEQENLNINTDLCLMEFLARYRDQAKPTREFVELAKRKIRYLNMDSSHFKKLNDKLKILNIEEAAQVIKGIAAVGKGLSYTLLNGFTSVTARRYAHMKYLIEVAHGENILSEMEEDEDDDSDRPNPNADDSF